MWKRAVFHVGTALDANPNPFCSRCSQRGLVGEIISRFERKGFKLRGLKLYQTPREVAEEHYKDLSSKPFYPALVDYIVSGPVVAMVRLI